MLNRWQRLCSRLEHTVEFNHSRLPLCCPSPQHVNRAADDMHIVMDMIIWPTFHKSQASSHVRISMFTKGLQWVYAVWQMKRIVIGQNRIMKVLLWTGNVMYKYELWDAADDKNWWIRTYVTLYEKLMKMKYHIQLVINLANNILYGFVFWWFDHFTVIG